ncbi:origin recognition complex subunit 1 [Nematocida sp. AWRm80]|nr:origin recognition complex subunit 1 [Nematocida sp. AWRm80]
MRVVPIGREEESSAIYNLLKEAITNREHGILYVSGMPGCGKTLTCTNVLGVIKENNPTINTVVINCGTLVLPSDIFTEIHNITLDNKIELQKEYKKIEESSVRVTEEILKNVEYTIILVDEIDMLISKNQNILYGLLELPSQCKNIYMITISNTYNLPDKRLTQKVRSRLGWNRINFTMYKQGQVANILREIPEDLKITEEAIEFCARKICTLNGDIRKGMQIIKFAVEHSKNNGIPVIGLTEIDTAIKYVYHSMQSSFIRSLSEYQKIILNIVSKKGYSYPNTLYSDFKLALSLEGYPRISFKEFEGILDRLCELGVLKGRSNSQAVETDYIPEELELIFKEKDCDQLDILYST